MLVCAFDVTDSNERQHQFDRIVRHFGHIDVLVNNAGILRIGYAHDLSEQDIQSQMQVNFLANVFLSRLVVRHWIDNYKTGRLIVNSSVAAHTPFPMYAAYAASKMALNVSRFYLFVHCLQRSLLQ